MVEITPAINVASFEEVERRIQLAEGYARTVHLDIADGTFTPSATWNDPEALGTVTSQVSFEVHIMVKNPERMIVPWLASRVERIIVHEESTRAVSDLLHQIRAMGKQAALAIAPSTSWERLIPYLEIVDMVGLLAVSPGPTGQVFDERTIEKIRALRARSATLPIEVDGGVHAGVASRCAHAGATRLVVGYALYDSGKPFAETFQHIVDDANS